jgi:hypothetical protein
MADEQKAAVYVSWVTFRKAIESLAEGVPNRIDRSTFTGLSGGVQSQLLAGMKFLGLISGDDKPSASLHALAVADEGKRKEKLKAILQEKYADIFALDLMKTTPQEVSDKLGESYGVSGDTKEKAIRFLLLALQYVGVPFSRFLKVPGAATSANGTRARRKPKTKSADNSDDDADDQADDAPGGTSRAVQLNSGGTLTLSASLDLFQLSPSDRNFVFSLIDALEKYEKEVAGQGTK